MLNLKELLKQEKEIWIRVEKSEKKRFLTLLKEQNVKWIDGQEINVEKDKISYFMGVNSNFELGFVSPMCWCSNIKNNTKKKYEFKELLNMEELNV